jgi:hypothetical protein
MKIKHFIIIAILFIAVACQQQQSGLLTIKEYAYLINEDSFQQIKPKLEGFQSLDSLWEKGIEQEKEISLPDYNSKPKLTEIVSLPDKKNLNPYTSIWYQKTIKLDKDYVLFVSPDDGAQVFFDSTIVDPIEPDVYDLTHKTGNDITITIRCMNQAMHGGLRGVRIIEKKNYLEYKDQRNVYDDLTLIHTKLTLIPELDDDIKETANKALKNQNRDTIEIALNLLSKYPINLVDPFLQKTDSTIHILWESDVNTSAKIIWGYDSTNLEFSESIQADSLNMYSFSKTFEMRKTVFYKIQYATTQTKLYNFTVAEPTENMIFLFGAIVKVGG